MYIAILNCISSVSMAVINILRKMLTFKLSKLRLQRKENEPFFTRSVLVRLIFQSAVLLLCPLPFLSKTRVCTLNAMTNMKFCYNANDLLQIMQFFKLQFVVKAFLVNSEFSSGSASRVCAIYGIKNTNTFVIKCMMKEMPLKFILSMFLFGIFVFGYALRVAEAPLSVADSSVNLSDLLSCMWVAMLGMTTVGYGDLYPRTTLGRVIVMVGCVYGMIVVSLMVNFVSQELELSPGECKAFTAINRLSIQNEIKTASGEIVNQLGKYQTLKRKGQPKAAERNKILQNVLGKNKEIKQLNNDYKNMTDFNNEEDIERNFAHMSQEIKEFKELMSLLKVGIAKYKENRDKKK